MSTWPASAASRPPRAGELDTLAAAIGTASARVRGGEVDMLADLADRIERLCADLAADGDADRLRAPLVGLVDELERLLLALEQGRDALARELVHSAARLAAGRAYRPAGDGRA